MKSEIGVTSRLCVTFEAHLGACFPANVDDDTSDNCEIINGPATILRYRRVIAQKTGDRVVAVT